VDYGLTTGSVVCNQILLTEGTVLGLGLQPVCGCFVKHGPANVFRSPVNHIADDRDSGQPSKTTKLVLRSAGSCLLTTARG
jgi:hypothetical protein